MTPAPLAEPRPRLEAVALAIRSWFVDPASAPPSVLDVPPVAETDAAMSPGTRAPVIAVVGLAPGCGATTIARALAGVLARTARTGAVVLDAGPVVTARPAARRAGAGPLAVALADVLPSPPRRAGRLWLASGGEAPRVVAACRPLAPLVLDVGYGQPAAPLAELADHVVLVAGPRVEPALASVVADAVRPLGVEPHLLVNRARHAGGFSEPVPMLVPPARTEARRVLRGRTPRGRFGRSVRELAGRL